VAVFFVLFDGKSRGAFSLSLILLCTLPLNKQNALHLIAIETLLSSADSDNNVHPGQGNKVAAQDAAVTKFNSVVR
jgi:hypothetical protein